MLKKVTFLILLLIIFSACSSKYQKLLKSTDNADKYEKSIKYYEDGDYYRALQLFDQLMPIYRGTEKAKKIYYYYAYSYYGDDNYMLASYHFRNYALTFPKSDKTEECLFMSAYCKYLDSPDYNLDQTDTYQAIKQLQLFTDKYPKSKRIPECNELIDKLRLKLETKNYQLAKLYFKTENYKAAIYSFNNLLKDYPDTKNKEKGLFYILKANYLYASNSIESKRQERYNSTVKAYNTFISVFPLSLLKKEAESIYNNSLKEINKLKTQNS
jgi:outer membrane protein assembly factor BamD